MALRFIEKALALIDTDDVVRRIDALHEAGVLLTLVGRYDDAIAAFGEMLRLAWKVGARNKGGAALNRIARVHRQRGEEGKAKDLLKRALALFRDAAICAASRHARRSRAGMRLEGTLDPALAAASEALEIRRAHGDQRGEAVSLTTLGTIELARDKFELGEKTCGRRSRSARPRRPRGDIQRQRARGARVRARRRDDGDRRMAQALEAAREIADRRSESFLLTNLGEAYLARVSWTRPRRTGGRAAHLAASSAICGRSPRSSASVGLVALKRGDEEAAEDPRARARARARVRRARVDRARPARHRPAARADALRSLRRRQPGGRAELPRERRELPPNRQREGGRALPRRARLPPDRARRPRPRARAAARGPDDHAANRARRRRAPDAYARRARVTRTARPR